MNPLKLIPLFGGGMELGVAANSLTEFESNCDYHQQILLPGIFDLKS